MSPIVLATLVKLLMSAPYEVADVKAIVDEVQANPDHMADVKDILTGLLKMVTDAGF